MLEYDFRCTQIFTTMMIDYKGGIHVCNFDYNHNYCLGNIRETTIKECWNSDLMRDLMALHKKGHWADNGHCRNCVLRSL
jgi:radical SAM protein with 4Fe4S-binding SPASM domain